VLEARPRQRGHAERAPLVPVAGMGPGKRSRAAVCPAPCAAALFVVYSVQRVMLDNCIIAANGPLGSYEEQARERDGMWVRLHNTRAPDLPLQ
jgi:hypothetical protein